MFKALLLNQTDGKTSAAVGDLDRSALPAGEVLITVSYSSLNYKDGLAITGKGRIIREFPMVPGIDLVGEVLESQDERYQPGDQVVVTGWGMGENHWGGMAQQARVKADWLVKLPEGLGPLQSMAIGTAGFTAMLCVMALEEGGVTPESGKVLVTGASGGVGSVAVTLLAQLGYQVTAVTGRSANCDWLQSLGASEVIPREQLQEKAKPLEKQLWAGVVDTTGSNILVKALAQTVYGGTVAACGLAAGFDLPATVMPFILRNVRLQGVDSVMCPPPRRSSAWRRLAQLLPAAYYQQATTEIGLADAPAWAERIVAGEVKGRVVVNPNR